MRGTMLDNETIRYQGIKEMKQAAAVRVHREKEKAERKVRDILRAKAGRPPLQPLARQPWLRVSFMRNRPTPIARSSTRPAAPTRKSASSSRTQKAKPHLSRPRHGSGSHNPNSKRPERPANSRPRHGSGSHNPNSKPQKRPATSRKASHASSKRRSKK